MKNTKTKTFCFLFPVLGASISEFPNIENAYLGDVDKEDDKYESCIFLLFKWTPSLTYAKFELLLLKHPCFLERYEPTKFHSMFVFTLPKGFSKDFKLILDGKYSNVSDRYKEHILSFLSSKINTDNIKAVLYKEKKRKDELEKSLNVKIDSHLDLLDPMNVEKEKFNKKDYVLHNKDR